MSEEAHSAARPAPTPRALLARTWPHLRAFLILAHVLGILIVSSPGIQQVGTAEDWQRPEHQQALHRWAGVLGMDKDDLEDRLWRFSRRYLDVRNAVFRPVAKLADYTGARQGWGMFGRPRLKSGYFQVEIYVDRKWQLIFRQRDDDADWNRWLFEHNRIRKLIGRLISTPKQPAYDEFMHWIAARVAADFPEATAARIALYTWPLHAPDEARAGKTREIEVARRNMLFLDNYRAKAKKGAP